LSIVISMREKSAEPVRMASTLPQFSASAQKNS
jgi:hypothetical protein